MNTPNSPLGDHLDHLGGVHSRGAVARSDRRLDAAVKGRLLTQRLAPADVIVCQRTFSTERPDEFSARNVPATRCPFTVKPSETLEWLRQAAVIALYRPCQWDPRPSALFSDLNGPGGSEAEQGDFSRRTIPPPDRLARFGGDQQKNLRPGQPTWSRIMGTDRAPTWTASGRRGVRSTACDAPHNGDEHRPESIDPTVRHPNTVCGIFQAAPHSSELPRVGDTGGLVRQRARRRQRMAAEMRPAIRPQNCVTTLEKAEQPPALHARTL